MAFVMAAITSVITTGFGFGYNQFVITTDSQSISRGDHNMLPNTS